MSMGYDWISLDIHIQTQWDITSTTFQNSYGDAFCEFLRLESLSVIALYKSFFFVNKKRDYITLCSKSNICQKITTILATCFATGVETRTCGTVYINIYCLRTLEL
jgi:hypothetical protein